MSDPNQPNVEPNLGSSDQQQQFHQQFENLVNPQGNQPLLDNNQSLEISSQSTPANFDFLEDAADPFSLASHPLSHQPPTLQESFNPFNSTQNQPLTDYTQDPNLNKDSGNQFDLFEQLTQPLDQIGSQVVHSEKPKQVESVESLADFSLPKQPQLPIEEPNLSSNYLEQPATESVKSEPVKSEPVESEAMSHEDQSSLWYDNGFNVGKKQDDILPSFEVDKDIKDHSQKDDKDDVGIGEERNAESKDEEKIKPPGGDDLKSFGIQVLPSQFTKPKKEAKEPIGSYSLSQPTSEQNLEQSKSALTESGRLKMDTNEEPTSSESVSSSSPSSCCLRAWLKPDLHPIVSNVIYWRDIQKSGIVFAIGLILLLSLVCCSVISVVAYTSLLTLTGTLSFRVYKSVLQAIQKSNEEKPFKKYLDHDLSPSPEKVHRLVDNSLERLNHVVKRFKSIFLVEDIFDSLKYFIGFWCLTYLGSWFNGLTLVILSYLAIFSIPKLYEMNKEQVDHYFSLACSQTQETVSKIKSKIPFPGASKEKHQ